MTGIDEQNPAWEILIDTMIRIAVALEKLTEGLE